MVVLKGGGGEPVLIVIPHSNLGLLKALRHEVNLLKGGDETLLSARHLGIER